MSKLLGSLTLFFPCYNDRGSIAGMIEAARNVAEELSGDYEILVIDDGSTDGSRELLESLKKAYPALRVIFHEKNLGYGAAIASGYRQASKEWVFYTDGDGQYEPADLRRLAPFAAQHDCINGTIERRHDSPLRILTGGLYRMACRLLFGVRFYDVNCDFRLMRRRLVENIRFTARSGAFGLELVAKLERAGTVIHGVPVRHLPRAHGRSQFFTPGRLMKTFADMVRLRKELTV